MLLCIFTYAKHLAMAPCKEEKYRQICFTVTIEMVVLVFCVHLSAAAASLFCLFLIQILRPYTNLSKLKIWDYYFSDQLFGGPSYDRELYEKSIAEDDESPLTPADRRTVNACYDNVLESQPDMQRWLLEVSVTHPW